MGTMQFLAVPYALYAQRSLEPGPQGPKGEIPVRRVFREFRGRKVIREILPLMIRC